MKPTVCWLVLTLFLVFTSVHGEETSAPQSNESQKTKFVDLDGDGFDDNLPDVNRDGIPEFMQFAPLIATAAISQNVIEFQAPSGHLDLGTGLHLSNSQRFSQLEFCVRGITRHRGGFGTGDEFVPGSGIGQGTSTSTCAGGVCRPR
ncbi:MAG TPA: hypothetical protein VN285_06330 [Candidatus Deferrimicrobium sp.]|nr:hypothetical protein [Candidatus Deferrimicrobium sp.]